MMTCFVVLFHLLIRICITSQTSIVKNDRFRSAVFRKVYVHKKLALTPIAEFTSSTLGDCGKKCLMTNLCKAFNLHAENGICQLLSKDRNDGNENFETSQGWKYYDSGLEEASVILIGEKCREENNPCYPCSCYGDKNEVRKCDCEFPVHQDSPAVHIPLREIAGKTILHYHTGSDTVGATSVAKALKSEIVEDQFGRGKVLATFGQQIYGDFEYSNLQDPKSDFTVSFWTRALTDQKCDTRVGSMSTAGIVISHEANRIIASVRSASYKVQHVYNLNEHWFIYWTHVVVVWSAENHGMKLYVNGSEGTEVYSEAETFQIQTAAKMAMTCNNGVFLTDIAIWWKTISLQQIMILFEQGKRSTSTNIGVDRPSCLHVKQHSTISTSGYYWLNFNIGSPTLAYCDMETDGGGWTLFSCVNTVDYSSGVTTSSISTDVAKVGDAGLTQNYLLSPHTLQQIQNITGYTQLRFYCYKTSPGYRIHIMTSADASGAAVVNYMTLKTSSRPQACSSFVKLTDDTSRLSSDCMSWGVDNKWGKSGYTGDNKLYFYLAYISRNYHYIIPEDAGSNYFCDDNSINWSSNEGEWKYYFR